MVGQSTPKILAFRHFLCISGSKLHCAVSCSEFRSDKFHIADKHNQEGTAHTSTICCYLYLRIILSIKKRQSVNHQPWGPCFTITNLLTLVARLPHLKLRRKVGRTCQCREQFQRLPDCYNCETSTSLLGYHSCILSPDAPCKATLHCGQCFEIYSESRTNYRGVAKELVYLFEEQHCIVLFCDSNL